MIAYKFLAGGGRAPFSDRPWSLGAWVDAAPGPLDPCRNGVHACEPLDLPYWIATELWRVELDGERIRGPQSVIARRGRLVSKVEAWNPANAREFAQQCRARAETFIAGLGATARAEELDRGAQYLATVTGSFEAGNYAVTAYASAIAFTVLAPSAIAAFHAERVEQGELLKRVLNL